MGLCRKKGFKHEPLTQPWRGRVWCNPPYGRTIGLWLARAWEAAQEGSAEVVVCLVPARTDTRWWHDYCARGEVRFIPGRVRFGGAKSGAPFPSAVVVFRNAAARYEMGRPAWKRETPGERPGVPGEPDSPARATPDSPATAGLIPRLPVGCRPAPDLPLCRGCPRFPALASPAGREDGLVASLLCPGVRLPSPAAACVLRNARGLAGHHHGRGRLASQ